MPRRKSTHIDDPRSLGKRLRAAREQAGLTLRELSFPGCSAAYISRIEAGDRTPSLQLVRELAERLSVSEEYLAKGTEPRARASDDRLVEAEVALRLDDRELGNRLLHEALEAARTDSERARALAGLGELAFREGDPQRTIEQLENALALYRSDVTAHAGLADTLGRAYAMVGDLNRAIEIFDRCLAEAERRGDRIEMVRFGVLLGNALIDGAEFERAEQVLERTLAAAEQSPDPVLRARLYWLESRLHAERDEPERAARYARKALAIVELTEDRSYTARAHQLLAHIELDRNRPNEALALLERGRPLLSESNAVEQAQFRLEEARALAALGKNEEAAALAMEVSGVIAGANVEDAGRSYTVLADVFVQIGDRGRARELYELAAELLERNPNRYLVRVYQRLAELLEAEGERHEALELLKKAVDVQMVPRPHAG